MRLFSLRFCRVCLAVVVLSVLTACGGGGGGGGSSSSPTVGSSPPPPPAPTPPPPQPDPGGDIVTNNLSGSVGDGPIVNGKLTVFDNQGVAVKSFTTDSTASYSFPVKVRGNLYPLTIESHGGTDIVTGTAPDFTMVTSVMKPAKRTIGNLNPFSTLIVKTAEASSRGLTDNSLASARTTVLNSLSFGLDTRLVADPLTSDIDEGNVAVMIKSSEVLGEMTRRTRDALLGTGVSSGDAVIDAIASDLIDGVLDGRGAAGTDTRIAAVANLVSAQVLVEALTNNLKVNGVSATAAMDNAIKQIRPNAPADAVTANVANTSAMLAQTITAVGAASALTGEPVLGDLVLALGSLPANTLPGDVKGSLPAGTNAALQSAVDRVALATDAELNIVNASVRSARPAEPSSGAFSFEAATVAVTEGEAVQLTIHRSSSSNAASVDWETFGGSASGSSDYTGKARTTLSFSAGQSAKTISIATVDDGATEGDENFTVKLFSPSSGSKLGSPVTATVTLLDTGTAPPPVVGSEFSFNSASASFTEGDNVLLTIRRSPSSEAASVDWETHSGTASGGSDYAGQGRTTLFFNAGQATKTISIASFDDGVPEGNENFTVRLYTPSGGSTLGSPRTVTVTLMDVGGNEPPPTTGTGSATLSWTPPTERTDGTPLTDLKAYKIYYGPSAGSLNQVIRISNPGLTRYVIEELASGTWKFAITAIDGTGQESSFSNVGSKTIP